MLWVVFYSFYWHSRVVLQSLSCLQQMFKIVIATKWLKLIVAVHMTMFTYIITALEINLNKQCCWKQFPLILLQLYVHIGTIETPVWIQFIGDIMLIWVANSPHSPYCKSWLLQPLIWNRETRENCKSTGHGIINNYLRPSLGLLEWLGWCHVSVM